MSLHISKLRGVDRATRHRLKRHGINYTHQLLEQSMEGADRLAGRLGLDSRVLEALIARADLARIRGIGVIFADMLRWIGIGTTGALARERADDLHARLKSLNDREHFARRAPTPEEVGNWIEQARSLSWRHDETC